MGSGHGHVPICLGRVSYTVIPHGHVIRSHRRAALPHEHKMNLDGAVVDDVESNVRAPAEGIALVESELRGWRSLPPYDECLIFGVCSCKFERSTSSNPPISQPVPTTPQVVERIRREKPLVDRIRKQRAEEFRENIDDDPERAEFWLENTINSAYQWWNTLVSVVPRERITWEFFQEEFRKKYISQKFVDQKRKEFLELKQGRMTVTGYEREFMRLSKNARECVSTEVIMCKRFEDGLNEDIRLLVGILEIRKFVVLVERA
ncbi:DNA-dependent protein kinase catalytic subunit [Gossypium australe]|uniref:DNA-dependent protein kinase catalytic subunit n=1 Tax=Gossypium australe TaxID=47621 RepID=A0A5B6X266_9ROSI|nr:DNA-dependent protein kinase catalytic subunit [Gossypium australe]